MINEFLAYTASLDGNRAESAGNAELVECDALIEFVLDRLIQQRSDIRELLLGFPSNQLGHNNNNNNIAQVRENPATASSPDASGNANPAPRRGTGLNPSATSVVQRLREVLRARSLRQSLSAEDNVVEGGNDSAGVSIDRRDASDNFEDPDVNSTTDAADNTLHAADARSSNVHIDESNIFNPELIFDPEQGFDLLRQSPHGRQLAASENQGREDEPRRSQDLVDSTTNMFNTNPQSTDLLAQAAAHVDRVTRRALAGRMLGRRENEFPPPLRETSPAGYILSPEGYILPAAHPPDPLPDSLTNSEEGSSEEQSPARVCYLHEEDSGAENFRNSLDAELGLRNHVDLPQPLLG